MSQYSFLNFYRLKEQWWELNSDKRYKVFKDFSANVSDCKICQSYIYSTSHFRSDCDFLIWNITESMESVEQYNIGLKQTEFYKYITLAYKYFSITRESKYLKGHEHKEQPQEDRTKINVLGKNYLFIYPFTKKREWYKLPENVRFLMMGEHFKIGHKYPDIKIHTTYCYGLHDYEFVLIFESDTMERFLELVEELRFSDASQYTLIDTPIFTCKKKTLSELEKEITL